MQKFQPNLVYILVNQVNNHHIVFFKTKSICLNECNLKESYIVFHPVQNINN